MPNAIPRRVRELGASPAMALSHVRRMLGHIRVLRLERCINHADALGLARLPALVLLVLTVESRLPVFAQQLPNDLMDAERGTTIKRPAH